MKLKRVNEVGKLPFKLETSIETFQLQRNFSFSLVFFQFRSVLSNFARFFPTSIGFFQLKHKLSNFRLSNFSFFSTTRIPVELIIKVCTTQFIFAELMFCIKYLIFCQIPLVVKSTDRLYESEMILE